MVQDFHYFEGTYRKGKTLHGMMNFNLGASLELGLTRSGLSSDCNADLATPERGLDSRPLKPSVYLDLHLGHPQKEVDLELSLSIGAAESDVTSMTLASSPIYAARPSFVQLVDEGSTSSKWNGPFLQLENPVAVENTVTNEGRKTRVKTCQYPGCRTGARGASGRCILHGGGRRCQRLGCKKGAEGSTVFCKSHGGGRRCEHLGCTKSAEGRTDFCISHGGGNRCHHEGCPHAARGKTGFCIGHGGGKRCKVENCKNGAEGLYGHCITHGGGRRCNYPDCRKGAQGSTKLCKAHGGGKRCTFLGCKKGAEGSTQLCKGHGGGKPCSFEGCPKSVHGATLFCVAHGGGKRCAVSECKTSARGKTDFCVAHGGGRRCKVEECDKSAQGRTDFCRAHGKLGLCSTHTAQMQDKCVHGENSTLSYLMKGKEIAVPEHYFMPMNNNPMNQSLEVPEGRVHGGGLMAMLMEIPNHASASGS